VGGLGDRDRTGPLPGLLVDLDFAGTLLDTPLA
jgi:hypothetical protein